MIKKLEEHLQRDFKSNYVIYWNNLSRLTNMLIISNFSLFFLTELVTRDRYYYTHRSLEIGFIFLIEFITYRLTAEVKATPYFRAKGAHKW